MQLKELYSLGKENLRRIKTNTPALEAYILLSESEVIDNMSELYAHPDKVIDQDLIDRFQNLMDRRLMREPIAYITGEKEFYSKTYKVNSSVLIPRPETELLVDEALSISNQTHPSLILEIGTGSGCIAATLAALCKDVKVVASDISQEALHIARENIAEHGLKDKILLINANLLDSFNSQSFDIVVSNPPYVSESELLLLEPEVREFEPEIALRAGTDGLKHIKEIISESSRVLKNGGWCILEIGQGQSEQVAKLFRQSGFTDVSTTKDLNDIDRVIKAKWKK